MPHHRMHSRYIIDLRTAGGGLFQIWILGGTTTTAVTRDGQKVDFDREALGLKKYKRGSNPFKPGEPGLFSKDEAVFMSHKIGRYVLGLGDLVYGYVTVDGKFDDSFWSGPR